MEQPAAVGAWTLRAPTYGEVLELVLRGPKDVEGLLWAKIDLIVCGLSRAEIKALPYPEGKKLADAVANVWERVTADAD